MCVYIKPSNSDPEDGRHPRADQGGVQRAGRLGRGLQRVHQDQEVLAVIPTGLQCCRQQLLQFAVLIIKMILPQCFSYVQKLNFGMDFECCCCAHPMNLQ